MTDTIREKIIQSIISRAAVIQYVASPFAGWNTDIGENVFRARQLRGHDEVPCIAIWPRPEESARKNSTVLNSMPVDIEGLAIIQPDTASVIAERILGDIIKCFTDPAWVRTPDYIDSIIYTGGGPESYPEEGNSVVGVKATFMVKYWTVSGDPYSQP